MVKIYEISVLNYKDTLPCVCECLSVFVCVREGEWCMLYFMSFKQLGGGGGLRVGGASYILCDLGAVDISIVNKDRFNTNTTSKIFFTPPNTPLPPNIPATTSSHSQNTPPHPPHTHTQIRCCRYLKVSNNRKDVNNNCLRSKFVSADFVSDRLKSLILYFQ